MYTERPGMSSNAVAMHCWKCMGAPDTPNGMRVYEKHPRAVIKERRGWVAGEAGTWRNPD
jgi:hypothetical protein